MRRLLGPPHDGELALNRRGRPTVSPARSPTVSAAYRRLEWRRIPWSVHDGSCEPLVAPHGGIPAKAWHGPRHPLRLLTCGAPSGSLLVVEPGGIEPPSISPTLQDLRT